MVIEPVRLIALVIAGALIESSIDFAYFGWLNHTKAGFKYEKVPTVWWSATMCLIGVCIAFGNANSLTREANWTSYGMMAGCLSLVFLHRYLKSTAIRRP